MKEKIKLMLGDNMLSLKKLPDNCIDAIVTDPPYGLSFMGKKWDYDVPSVELWKEVFRVLKPGGHVLSFGGTRTYHRMVVNMEDAGFEIRDQIMWLYGQGFPKSRNVGKDIEKINVGGKKNLKQIGTKKGLNNEDGTSGFAYKETYVPGISIGGKQLQGEIPVYEINNEYNGWGTALKPAVEPICLARKPISEKTVAENVIKWKTGGLNIDGCRVGDDIISTHNAPKGTFAGGEENRGSDTSSYDEHQGRFPANVILDESAGEMLDKQSGKLNKQGKWKGDKNKSCKYNDATSYEIGGQRNNVYLDEGGASRFFYCAKVSKKERNLGLDDFEDNPISINTPHNSKSLEDRYKMVTKNNHPTIKPVDLMRYLCRLITPKGGIILDPYMGSGSTGIAALLEDFRFCGMEMDEEYMKISEARIKEYKKYDK